MRPKFNNFDATGGLPNVHNYFRFEASWNQPCGTYILCNGTFREMYFWLFYSTF